MVVGYHHFRKPPYVAKTFKIFYFWKNFLTNLCSVVPEVAQNCGECSLQMSFCSPSTRRDGCIFQQCLCAAMPLDGELLWDKGREMHSIQQINLIWSCTRCNSHIVKLQSLVNLVYLQLYLCSLWCIFMYFWPSPDLWTHKQSVLNIVYTSIWANFTVNVLKVSETIPGDGHRIIGG